MISPQSSPESHPVSHHPERDVAGSGELSVVVTSDRGWRAQQREAERARMASYIARVGDIPGRCADCAFREGSDASTSRMVLHCVEMCLLDDGNNFCCHHGEPDRPCVGFIALRESFVPKAHPAPYTPTGASPARLIGSAT